MARHRARDLSSIVEQRTDEVVADIAAAQRQRAEAERAGLSIRRKDPLVTRTIRWFDHQFEQNHIADALRAVFGDR